MDTGAGSGGGVADRKAPGNASVAVALAWIVPGLGHAYLGWWRRAALYFAIITFMFAFGLWLEGSLSRPDGRTLAFLATLADLGAGGPYLLARALGWGAGRAAAATHEYGNTFHWSAGVMNMLLVLDAYDIAHGRKVLGRGATAEPEMAA